MIFRQLSRFFRYNARSASNFIHLESVLKYMKRFPSSTTLILLLLALYWAFRSLMPSYNGQDKVPESSFSTDRALTHVKQISQKPHGVGFPAHSEVREYIVSELEKMGLETSLQEGYTPGDWGNLSKATNILARIKGSEKGKALLLLSHYDSSPHSSLGASDAGSGVATVLEGLRAFLAEKKQHANDIIILLSDAEELGLNGADLFVSQHPWTREVGLVLNFEARGSGGPSYMLLETNRGNARLIEEYTKAIPNHTVANSLAYSIYKMLPNDTDLTVFREDADIEGFNFAFIDDHFDYHTAQDSYERLDRNSLMHQGEYLMPLLQHFSNTDLTNLKSPNDLVYFSIPFFKLVSYPYEWIWPMFGLAVLLFIVLLIYGLRRKSLKVNQIALGFAPALITLGLNGLIGYFGWSVLEVLYPQYKDMLHGFTYNGHVYIIAFVLLSSGICFWVYNKFKKLRPANQLVAPLVIWLIICAAAGDSLKGASFLIVPVFALLAAFMVMINQRRPNAYLLVFLCIPALWILGPFVKMFPVGLGLKMIITVTVLVTLTFVLLLPVFGFYRKKHRLAHLCFFLFAIAMGYAHFNSGFDKDNAKPSSLLYVLDADKNTAKWATYDTKLINWNAQFLGKDKFKPEKLAEQTISSKYGSGFSFVNDAPLKQIAAPVIEKGLDTIIGDERILDICIKPQRNVNRLEIFTNPISVKSAIANGAQLTDYFLENRKRGKLLTHYISQNAFTDLQLRIPKDSVLELTIYESSFDLLTNKQFSVPQRPEHSIPMPFVLNDAILVTKTIRFE